MRSGVTSGGNTLRKSHISSMVVDFNLPKTGVAWQWELGTMFFRQANLSDAPRNGQSRQVACCNVRLRFDAET
jgi:hypothetical protein